MMNAKPITLMDAVNDLRGFSSPQKNRARMHARTPLVRIAAEIWSQDKALWDELCHRLSEQERRNVAHFKESR